MFIVYALYSPGHNKIYIGYTSNLELRLNQHNSTSDKGFTIKYRPWIVIHSESFATKKSAMDREKQLKSAAGRKFIRSLTDNIQ
jgi:putative endonuclease